MKEWLKLPHNQHLEWSESDRRRARGGGGDGQRPRRRSGPSSHPHSRLLTIGRHREQWRAPNIRVVARGWQQRGGGRKAERDGRSAPGRRAGESPALSFPVGRRWTIGRRRRRMGAKWPRWPGLPRREARGGFSRPFPPFRNYFRFCKSTSGLTPTSIRTLFPYYTGF